MIVSTRVVVSEVTVACSGLGSDGGVALRKRGTIRHTKYSPSRRREVVEKLKEEKDGHTKPSYWHKQETVVGGRKCGVV
jgi:hypothetical protein